MNNVDVFNDTQNRIQNNEELQRLTQNAIENTCVLEEGFRSDHQPHYEDTNVSVSGNLTLIAAFRLADAGEKTAVLNFANPVEPGGGVLRGANAQEEYLCRAGNLYNCLISPRAQPYYDYHKRLLDMNRFGGMFLGSDRIVYSSDVVFFKEDQGYYPGKACSPAQVCTDQWRTLDVITCAAPIFSSGGERLPDGDLYHLFCRRIRNILESAMAHGVEALVLGAFGCGAFHNPPTVVAKAFQDVLREERYLHAFADIVFAIKWTGGFCENLEAFEKVFS